VNNAAALKKFERELAARGKVINSAIKDYHGIVFTLVATALLEATPVLTGRARRSWVFSVGTPSSRVFTQTSEATETGAPITATEARRIKSAVRRLQQLPVGQVMWMVSNLHYVPELDQGSSLKAPQGIRLIALARAVADGGPIPSGIRRKLVQLGLRV